MATFEDVQKAENKELQGVRERTAKGKGTRLPDKTVGLAFSGGGIPVSYTHLTLPTIYSV